MRWSGRGQAGFEKSLEGDEKWILARGKVVVM
jgi:hypothetical protein